LLKYIHILVIIPKTHLKLHHLKKIKCIFFQLKHSLLMLMAPFYYRKMVKFNTKKTWWNHEYLFYLFQKNWIRFIIISKIEFIFFQINLMLKFFYVCKVGIIIIKVTFFVPNFLFSFLVFFLLFTFSSNLLKYFKILVIIPKNH